MHLTSTDKIITSYTAMIIFLGVLSDIYVLDQFGLIFSGLVVMLNFILGLMLLSIESIRNSCMNKFSLALLLFVLFLFLHSVILVPITSPLKILQLSGYCLNILCFGILISTYFIRNNGAFELFFKFTLYVITFLSLTTIISQFIRSDDLFSYKASLNYQLGFINASGGIINHALVMGAISGLGILFSLGSKILFNNKGSMINLILLINGLSLFITMSRGAILGVFVSLVIFYGLNLFKVRKLFAPIVLSAIFGFFTLSFLINYFESISFFNSYLRIENGLSGREILYPIGLSIFLDNFYLGLGFQSASNILDSLSSSIPGWLTTKGGFHNTFIDISVNHGVFALVFYASFYLFPLINNFTGPSLSAKKRIFYISLVTYFFINCFFLTYNIGGTRIFPIIMTIMLGYISNKYIKYTH